MSVPSSSASASAAASLAAQMDAAFAALPEHTRADARARCATCPVVVVGGGPVGLWFAVQLRLRSPASHVVIIERYAEYRRKHVLRLARSVFFRATTTACPALDELTKRWRAEKLVRTVDLEQGLRTVAEQLGVLVLRNVLVSDPQALVDAYFPQTRVLVGADGAHSTVRRAMFGEEMRGEHDLEYIVEIKYETEQSSALSLLDMYKTRKHLGHLIFEYVRKAKGDAHAAAEHDGDAPPSYGLSAPPASSTSAISLPSDTTVTTTPVTVHFVVRRHVYDALRSAPKWSIDTVPHAEFARVIRQWWDVKAALAGEQRVPGSELIHVIKLCTYRSAAFLQPLLIKGDESDVRRYAVLVGDAAFGVPFFRALNNGIRGATELARATAHMLNHSFALAHLHMLTWRDYMGMTANNEIFAAQTKDTVLTVAKAIGDIVRALPQQLQLFRLRSRDIKKPEPAAAAAPAGPAAASTPAVLEIGDADDDDDDDAAADHTHERGRRDSDDEYAGSLH